MKFSNLSPLAAQAFGSLRNQRGQGLIELALTVAIFTGVCMGIIELGRTFMVANLITHAAREGAGAAAQIASASRDTGSNAGLIKGSDKATIISQVRTEIKGALDAAQTDAFTITITQSPSAGGVVTSPTIPYVSVNITGQVGYIFKILGATSFAVNRSVSFRDEGR